MEKRLFGLIGYPLAHSFSARYFTEKFEREKISDVQYRSLEIDSIDKLPALLSQYPSLTGFSVTIPYKEQIIPYLHTIDPEAEKVGAVNCVKITEGRLKGYNTDVYGFHKSLLAFLDDFRPKSALVLGTGGAAKAVCSVLKRMEIEVTIVSRREERGRITYDDLDGKIISDNKLIVNTTPLGTYPDVESFPNIPYHHLTASHYLFDLVYNPAQTVFMALGARQGARVINGYDMLVGQAECAWQIWNSKGEE